MKRIDTMSKEEIAAELVRIASYCTETYRLNQAAAGASSKAPYGSRTQGEAIGRQDMCAKICDDLYLTFGIEAQHPQGGRMSTNAEKPAQKFAVLISHGRRRWFVDDIFDDPVRACGCAGEYLAAAKAKRFAGWRAEVFELMLRGQFSTREIKSPSGVDVRFSASAGPAGVL